MPSFVALAPGVLGTTRIDGARTNFMLDGISSVNTGGNQQGIQLNPDAIAEVTHDDAADGPGHEADGVGAEAAGVVDDD